VVRHRRVGLLVHPDWPIGEPSVGPNRIVLPPRPASVPASLACCVFEAIVRPRPLFDATVFGIEVHGSHCSVGTVLVP